MIFELLVLFMAGWGAGIITGLIGASAVALVIPALMIFLNYEAYVAIGIALAIDVFASSMAAYTYGQHGNTDLKAGLQMAVAAVAGAFIGSWLSAPIPSTSLGGTSGFITLCIGIAFVLEPETDTAKDFQELEIIKSVKTVLQKKKQLSSVAIGLGIGIVSGVIGAGGGLMFLIALVVALDFPIHKAVGTSVIIMIFTALSGAIGHIYYGEIMLTAMFIGSIGGVIGSRSASTFANLATEKQLKRTAGIVFMLMGGALFIAEVIL
ncbi:MAG: sulfite exporter TauE/SafE family protein [Candidatus Thermoplasmatota archaeon]